MEAERYARVRALFHRWCDVSAERPSCDPESFAASASNDPEVRAALLELIRADAAGDEAIVDRPIFSGDMPRDLAREILSDQVTEMPAEIGPYRVIERIGEGGFGVVYRAERVEPMRQEVAIKVIKPGMDSRAVIARFEYERQAMAMMDHPGIARVFDAGCTPRGLPYVVMEFVRGATITQACDDREMDIDQRIRLFMRVCDAVQHAHGRGLIHRDLKPGNILVADAEGGPVPKVIDFGVAKAIGADGLERTLTETPMLIGTLEYMSPEQADLATDLVDIRCDVYALGVILHELLTGLTPHDLAGVSGSGLTAVRRRITESPLVRSSDRLLRGHPSDAARDAVAQARGGTAESIARRLRGELDWIVRRAIEPDPARRYPTVRALSDDLERMLCGEPIEARPPDVGYRLRSFARRHRAAVSTLVGIAVMLVLGALVSTSMMIDARAQRQRAEEQEAMARSQRDFALEQEARALAAQRDAEWQAYVANLAAAEASIRVGDVAEARRRLFGAPIDLREWEWHHLTHRLDRSAERLAPYTAAVKHLALTPDGQMLVTLCDHRNVTLTSLVDDRSRTIIPMREAWLTDIVIAPGGRYAIVGTDGAGAVRVDLHEASIVRRVHPGDGHVIAMALHPHGHTLYLGMRSGEIFRWTQVNDVIEEMPAARVGEVTALSLSPDGRTLVVADRAARIMAVETNGGSRWTLSLDGTFSEALAFSPDGARLAAGLMDGRILFIDAEHGQVRAPVTAHASQVRAIAFSACGTRLYSAGTDRVVRVIDVDRALPVARLLGHEGEVYGLAVHPDGRVASSGFDAKVRWWDSGSDDVPSLGGHSAWVYAVALSDDGTTVYSGGGWRPLLDGTVRGWCAETRRERWRWEGDPAQIVWRLAVRPGSGELALVQAQRAVMLDDAGREVWSVDLGASLSAISFSPEGDRLAVKPWDHADVIVLCAEDGSVIGSIPDSGDGVIAEWAPDGARLITQGPQRSLVVRDLQGSVLQSIPAPDGTPPTARIRWAAWDPFGKLVLAAWEGRRDAVLINVESAAMLALLEGHSDVVFAGLFLPGTDRLATASADGTIRIWSSRTGREVLTLHGHGFMVMSLAVGADGRRLISGSADQTLRIWNAEHPADDAPDHGHSSHAAHASSQQSP